MNSGQVTESGNAVTGWNYSPNGIANDACTGLATAYLPAGASGRLKSKVIESAGGNWPAMHLNNSAAPTANVDPGALVGLELYSGSIYSSQNGGSFNNLGAAPALPFWWAIDFDGATGTATFYTSTDDVTYTQIGSPIAGLSIVDQWPGCTGDSPSNPQTIGEFVTSGGFVPYP